MPGTLDGARAVQQALGDSGNAPARPHFAEYLVRAGHVKDRGEAFRKWLGAGKLGDVKLHWPTLEETVATLRQSNAWVSLAHPMHYELTRSKRRRLIADYIQAGGQALEVVNGMMPAEQVGTMSILTREFGLLASAGSDFHGPGTWGEIGAYRPLPEDLPPLWRRFSMNSLWRYEQDDYVSQFFQIHAENPQARLIKQAVEIIRKGGVVVYPTDSAYAMGCQIGDKTAVERVRRLRQLDKNHNFTLLCCDLSQMGTFAKIDTATFRLLKAHVPGRTPSSSTPRAKCHVC